jgi:hypothetical protein
LPEEWLTERFQQVGAILRKSLSPSSSAIFLAFVAISRVLRYVFVREDVSAVPEGSILAASEHPLPGLQFPISSTALGSLQKLGFASAGADDAPALRGMGAMELGGRYHELNRVLALEVPQIGRELLDVIGRGDKVAILKYDSKVETLVDFNQGHDLLDKVFDQLSPPRLFRGAA